MTYNSGILGPAATTQPGRRLEEKPGKTICIKYCTSHKNAGAGQAPTQPSFSWLVYTYSPFISCVITPRSPSILAVNEQSSPARKLQAGPLHFAPVGGRKQEKHRGEGRATPTKTSGKWRGRLASRGAAAALPSSRPRAQPHHPVATTRRTRAKT